MGKKQILVVDGDITLSEKLKQNLEAEEYIVDVVYQGKDAMMILGRKWIDLIITSITLQGGMNGIHFLQEIKKHKDFRKIPVVVQSSKINMEKIVKLFDVKLFVVKPYNMSDFRKQIIEILENK